jgi:hypothetical protein
MKIESKMRFFEQLSGDSSKKKEIIDALCEEGHRNSSEQKETGLRIISLRIGKTIGAEWQLKSGRKSLTIGFLRIHHI